MAAQQKVRSHKAELWPVPAGRVAPAAVVAGAVVLGLCYLLSRGGEEGSRRFWLAYLNNFSFFLTLSLGALFFVMLQHLTRSGWSVVVRRPAELLAANLIVLVVLFVPIGVVVAGGSGVLYRWAQPVPADFEAGHGHGDRAHAEAAAAGDHSAGDAPGHGQGLDELTLQKRPFLNPTFFLIRCVFYLAVWTGLAVWFWRGSLRQDASGSIDLTLRMQAVSAPMMVVFALTLTFASFDLLMSLDAHWFSTIFGVYVFSGAVVGFLALLILVLMGVQRRGLLTECITVEHYHDLGKLLFAFVFFWAYIAFSQYMLIWYGNLPEETGWFIRRGAAVHEPNAWSGVLLLLLFGHFLVPFIVLMSREVKRRRAALAGSAAWLLLMHWVDVYWLVMPEFTTAHLPLGVAEVGGLLGMAAIYVGGLAWLAAGCNLVPVGDPRLAESLAFENL